MTDPNANYEPLGKRAQANQAGTSYQQVKLDIKRVVRFIVLTGAVLLIMALALDNPVSLFLTVPLVALVLVANYYTRRSTTPKWRRS